LSVSYYFSPSAGATRPVPNRFAAAHDSFHNFRYRTGPRRALPPTVDPIPQSLDAKRLRRNRHRLPQRALRLAYARRVP
jgi:hypothetical protein